jgi:hypothetical protein
MLCNALSEALQQAGVETPSRGPSLVDGPAELTVGQYVLQQPFILLQAQQASSQKPLDDTLQFWSLGFAHG